MKLDFSRLTNAINAIGQGFASAEEFVAKHRELTDAASALLADAQKVPTVDELAGHIKDLVEQLGKL